MTLVPMSADVTTTLLAATGITSTSLRGLTTGLLHAIYTPGHSHLRPPPPPARLHHHRIEYANRYVLTPDGTRVVIFYTKLHNRLLRPLLAADQPPATGTALTTLPSLYAAGQPSVRSSPGIWPWPLRRAPAPARRLRS